MVLEFLNGDQHALDGLRGHPKPLQCKASDGVNYAVITGFSIIRINRICILLWIDDAIISSKFISILIGMDVYVILKLHFSRTFD